MLFGKSVTTGDPCRGHGRKKDEFFTNLRVEMYCFRMMPIAAAPASISGLLVFQYAHQLQLTGVAFVYPGQQDNGPVRR
jgi:hypothetical protein